MNKFFKTILATLIILGIGFSSAACKGCNSSKSKTEQNFKKSCKILAVGNSFSDDALWYAAQTALDLGAESITIGILYIAGGSIRQHYYNSLNGAKDYTYRKTTDGNWENLEKKTLLYGLADEDWDIISVQQSSPLSGKAESMDSTLDKLLEYIHANSTNPNVKTVYHMTWAYQSDATQLAFLDYDCNQEKMYKAITDTVQSAVKEARADKFDYIIPSGTAIQNTRTSYIGDNLTRDGQHLNDLGMAVAAVTFIGTIIDLNLNDLKYIPQNCNLTDLPLVIESAKNAITVPFKVTASALESN